MTVWHLHVNDKVIYGCDVELTVCFCVTLAPWTNQASVVSNPPAQCLLVAMQKVKTLPLTHASDNVLSLTYRAGHDRIQVRCCEPELRLTLKNMQSK